MAWVALGRTASGARALQVGADGVLAEVDAASEAAALNTLGVATEVHLRLGGGPPDQMPAAILPSAGRHLPVLVQDQPADVVGSWTRLRIAGFLAQRADWDGVICAVEGDVTHWVHVSAGEAVSSASFLSLRLIASLKGAAAPDPEAMADSQSRPERLAQHLRQAEVAGNSAAITGHLIGAELAASRVYWLGQNVGLIADDEAQSPYAIALAAQGVPVEPASLSAVEGAGLLAVATALGLPG